MSHMLSLSNKFDVNSGLLSRTGELMNAVPQGTPCQLRLALAHAAGAVKSYSQNANFIKGLTIGS